jgi:hypothetical protein
MAEQINLNKTVYSKTQYERVIDTSFTQLVEPTPVPPISIPSISVAEFFTNYQEIFYQIPKFGELNSHEYLIRTSQAYIGNINNTDIDITQALIDEITQLRQENLDLQQQIFNNQSTVDING